VKNASQVRINHGIGGVEASGVLRVFPETTTTYELFASSQKGTFNEKVEIKVATRQRHVPSPAREAR